MRKLIYMMCALLLVGCAQTVASAQSPGEVPSPSTTTEETPTPSATPTHLAVYPAYSPYGDPDNGEQICSLVTTGDLEEVFGPADYAAFPDSAVGEGVGIVYWCMYTDEVPPDGNIYRNPQFFLYADVDVNDYIAAGRFELGRVNQERTVQEVTGVGDEAYWVGLSDEFGSPSLYARLLNVRLHLSVATPIVILEGLAHYEEIMRRALVRQLDVVPPPTPTPAPFQLTPEVITAEDRTRLSENSACQSTDTYALQHALSYDMVEVFLESEALATQDPTQTGGCRIYYVDHTGQQVDAWIMTYEIKASVEEAQSALPSGRPTLIPLLNPAVWVTDSSLHVSRGNVYFVFEVPRVVEAPYTQPDVESHASGSAEFFTYQYGTREDTP